MAKESFFVSNGRRQTRANTSPCLLYSFIFLKILFSVLFICVLHVCTDKHDMGALVEVRGTAC